MLVRPLPLLTSLVHAPYPRFRDRTPTLLFSTPNASTTYHNRRHPLNIPMTSPASGSADPAPESKSKQISSSKPSVNPPSHARRLLILSLRYAISPKEYAIIRRRILLKGPSSIALRTPSKSQFDAVCNQAEDFIPASTRAGLRVFLASNLVLNLWDVVSEKLSKRKGGKEL